MRVHPLRSKGVVVGVPVAAAVAFGAHAVLGVTPLSDQHDTQASSSTTQAGAPVQSYGLAPSPPPTTLGLLSGPSTSPADTSGASYASTPAGSHTTRISGSSTAHQAAPAGSVPIARAAGAPVKAAAPSMMTFAPARAAAAPAAAAKPVAAAAPTHEAAPQTAARAAAPAARTAPAQDDSPGDEQSSSGGSLLGVDVGVAKVSVLSFGG
jgi:hypothetical protein